MKARKQYLKTVEDDHKALLNRKKIIENRKEFLENQEKAKVSEKLLTVLPLLTDFLRMSK